MIELAILGLMSVFFVMFVLAAAAIVVGLILAPFMILLDWNDFSYVWRTVEVFVGLIMIISALMLAWDYLKGNCKAIR